MGLAKRAQGGEWNGGPPPLGHDLVDTGERKGQRVRRVLVPNQGAVLVREIYERYVGGQGMRRLTLWLNREKGVKSLRGGSFTDATVSGILKNPVYAGLSAWNWGVKNGPCNPNAAVAEGKHETIVPRDLWEQAQAVGERRISLPPRQATAGNLLAGIGRCGVCGGGLKINYSVKEKQYRFYRCGNYATKGTCRVSAISANQVEASFVEAVGNLATGLTAPDLAHSVMATLLQDQRGGQEQLAPEEIRRQISQVKQAVAVWDSALEQGKIEFAVWQEKTASHYIRLKDLECQLGTARETKQVSLAIEALTEHLLNFRQIWDEATQEERKAIAISFFKEARVFHDKRVEVVPRLSYSPG